MLTGFDRVVGLREGRLAFDLPLARVEPALLAELYGSELSLEGR
jgi:ABC-type phosphate/phosphonate transport system ATPase subunit